MINEPKIDEEKIALNVTKAKIFLKKKIPVHILKIDREWWNGELQEVRDDFLTINERKKGVHVLFFQEIYSIEQLEERE